MYPNDGIFKSDDPLTYQVHEMLSHLKIGLLSGFEFLTLGEVFLGVTFHQQTFLFYKIFWVSKQNFEKMAHID